MNARPADPAPNAVLFYAPATFDPALFPELAGLHEESLWLLHKIISLDLTYRHSRNWVNISRQTIRAFIHPSKANLVRDTLLKHRVIECNGHYLQGVHSMGYRIGKEYRGQIKRVRVTKKTLVAKMLRHRIRYGDSPIPESRLAAVHQHLLASLRRVRIDVAKAYQEAERLPERKPKPRRLGARRRARMVKGVLQQASYRKALCRIAVDQIAEGQLDFTVDEQGRVHTPVTRLFAAARSCLSIEGSPLVSIDLRNSQLIFFALLLLEHRYGMQAGDHAEEDVSVGNGVPPAPPSPLSFFPLVVQAVRCPALTETPLAGENHAERASSLLAADEQEFVSRVMDGTIYDHLLEQYNGRVEQDQRIASRGEFKQQFFKAVLYGDNGRAYASQSPMALLFQSLYPSVWRFIVSQKAEDWRRLAIRMQQREARFMIGRVCGRLMEHHRAIPLLTVHDSIMTTPEHLPTVHRILVEEFERLGVRPAFKIEGMLEQN